MTQIKRVCFLTVEGPRYSVPPFGDKLIFSEYDDGDGGRVNVIEVHNPTDEDFMIPSGWIVGANLLQVRTFNHSELVKAGESILADVSCVEKGRWGNGQNETDGGRAPFSVIGAGWDYDAERRLWVIDRNSRQSRVWSQVSRQESRSGVRDTSSLQQFMMEDSGHAAVQSRVQQISRDTLKTYDEQNGFLVAVDGEPLLMEVFADSRNIENTIQETIRGISFDIAHLDFEPALDSDVRRFVEEANLRGLSRTQIDDWASQFAGGNHGVDTRATKDRDGLLIHSSTTSTTTARRRSLLGALCLWGIQGQHRSLPAVVRCAIQRCDLRHQGASDACWREVFVIWVLNPCLKGAHSG